MISKNNISSSLALVVLITFSGCGNNLEGIYVANHHFGYDTLKIYSDNKFIRVFYDESYKRNSQIFSDTGTWKYDGDRVYFNDWVDRNEGVEHLIGHGKVVFITDVKKKYFCNETKLMIDYDNDYCYLKKK